MKFWLTAALMAMPCCSSWAAEKTKNKTDAKSGIAWYGTWESGLAAAKRTGRPILLMSAAPHCHQVPGMW
jgi:hypothetical protein